jgi:hypothetical protein
MSTVSNFVYRKACDDFLKLAPEIQEQNNVVKQLRKEQKANIDIIKKHMVENDLTSVSVGGFTFEREEVERCSFTEKNLEEFLEDPSILDSYREVYSNKGEKFKLNRPKKRRKDT